MNIKKYMFPFFIFLFLNGAGLVLGMDAPIVALRPIDRVFLLACKKNTDTSFALKNGANPESIEPETGYTGLHYACMNGNLDRVKWFLKDHWNLLNIQGKDGSDPVEVSSEYKQIPIEQYLIDSQLIFLTKEFSGPFFKSTATDLLDRGGNVNAKADDVVEPMPELQGFTPLLYACLAGEVEKAKLLLSRGANVNQKSAIGLFPLYVIFSSMTGGKDESKRLELTKLLLAHGADLGLTGPGHHGILAVAVRSNSPRCIKLFLSKNIDVNTVDTEGHNALYEAVADNLPHLIPLLFDAGVKPISDRIGASLVHMAADRNNAPILKELIKRGLDVNLVDNEGQTPLHWAAESAGVEVIKTLLDAGAFINAVDKNGKTPLMLAKTNSHKGSLTYLQKESRKAATAEKNIPVIEQSAPTKKGTEEAVEQGTKIPKKKKPTKKKKKKKELATPVPASETHEEEDLLSRMVEESSAHTEELKKKLLDLQEENRKHTQAQTEAKQPDVAPLETEPAPVEQAQIPQLSKTKKPKKSLIERVQEKAVDVFITPKTKKSFADVAATQIPQKQAKKEKGEKITYGNLEVTLPEGQRRLMLTNQENPLANINKYDKRVEEKRNKPDDYFHNFPISVERELGSLAQSKMLKPPTKDHTAKMEYKIPATVSVGENYIFPGAFEFVVQDETMLHRFFKPDKKIDKRKMLTLPVPTGDKGGTELPK